MHSDELLITSKLLIRFAKRSKDILIPRYNASRMFDIDMSHIIIHHHKTTDEREREI